MAKITYGELIDKIAEDTDYTKASVEAMMKSLRSNIETAVQNHDEVVMPGFMSIKTAERKERQSINPQTKEMMTVPGKTVCKIKPSKKLMDLAAGN